MSELKMTRGDDRTFDIDIADQDGAAVDLSTFEGLWFTAKRRISDSDEDAVFQKALGQGLELDTEIDGRASVTVDAADTTDLPDHNTRLVWDVQVKDGEGSVVTVAAGTLTVTPDVTRATVSSS